MTIIGLVVLPGMLNASPADRARVPVIYWLAREPLMAIFLLLVPLSIAISILRYRLWEIDVLINRTLVYVPLTGIIGGLYAASTAITQSLFVAVTGAQSDAAVVVTTLAIFGAFEPIKKVLQDLVDKRVRDAPDRTDILEDFDRRVQAVVEVIDVHAITGALLSSAMSAFGARSGAFYLLHDGSPQLVHSSGDGLDEARLTVPLICDGALLGRLVLGERHSGSDYTTEEQAALQHTAGRVARVIALVGKG
jgi:hypothetical protein